MPSEGIKTNQQWKLDVLWCGLEMERREVSHDLELLREMGGRWLVKVDWLEWDPLEPTWTQLHCAQVTD